MPTEIIVALANKPGALAKVAEALGGAGVNFQGVGYASGARGTLRVIADEPERALAALKSAKIKVQKTRETVELTLPDRPGELAALTRKLAKGRVNIEAFYVVGGTPEGFTASSRRTRSRKRRRSFAVDGCEGSLKGFSEAVLKEPREDHRSRAPATLNGQCKVVVSRLRGHRLQSVPGLKGVGRVAVAGLRDRCAVIVTRLGDPRGVADTRLVEHGLIGSASARPTVATDILEPTEPFSGAPRQPLHLTFIKVARIRIAAYAVIPAERVEVVTVLIDAGRKRRREGGSGEQGGEGD